MSERFDYTVAKTNGKGHSLPVRSLKYLTKMNRIILSIFAISTCFAIGKQQNACIYMFLIVLL